MSDLLHSRGMQLACHSFSDSEVLQLAQVAMNASEFSGVYPRGFRVWVRKGKTPLADYPAVGLPMVIFSDRLVAQLLPLIKQDIELFPAPLFVKDTDIEIEGYQFVHVRSVVDCLDSSRSHPRYVGGRIVGYSGITLRANSVSQQMFRYEIDGIPSAETIVTRQVVQLLCGGGFTGIGFQPVRSS